MGLLSADHQDKVRTTTVNQAWNKNTMTCWLDKSLIHNESDPQQENKISPSLPGGNFYSIINRCSTFVTVIQHKKPNTHQTQLHKHISASSFFFCHHIFWCHLESKSQCTNLHFLTITITFTISLKRTLTSRNDRYLVNCPSSFTKITSWSVIPWKLISSHHPGISNNWKSHWFPKDRKD